MDYKDLQQQLESLMSLGYNREEIVKIVATAPSIFSYTPEGIELILNSIPVSKEDLTTNSDTTPFVAVKEKNRRNR